MYWSHQLEEMESLIAWSMEYIILIEGANSQIFKMQLKPSKKGREKQHLVGSLHLRKWSLILLSSNQETITQLKYQKYVVIHTAQLQLPLLANSCMTISILHKSARLFLIKYSLLIVASNKSASKRTVCKSSQITQTMKQNLVLDLPTNLITLSSIPKFAKNFQIHLNSLKTLRILFRQKIHSSHKILLQSVAKIGSELLFLMYNFQALFFEH